MKKLTIISSITSIVVLLMVFTNSAFSAAPSNFPKPPAKACYAFDDFPTDFIIVKIVPGNELVTGIYRQCVRGVQPGTGSADAVMVGSIQDVAGASAIPPNNVLTQIALVGSIASGNFDDGPNKASQCWLHLLFEDNKMTTGVAIGACGWIAGATGPGANFDLQLPDDQLAPEPTPIHQIDCKDVLSLGPDPTNPTCESLLPDQDM